MRIRGALLAGLAVMAALSSVPEASAAPGAGCSWPVVGNEDTLNVAFPDESAHYWLAAFPTGGPVVRIRIDGQYAKARYFSFNAYNAAQRPVGALADFQIDPKAGSANPFRGAPESAGRDYTAYIAFADKPAQPAPNTLYTGATNPIGAVLYRVYVPDDPTSAEGSVPLPTLTVERADGSTQIVTLGQCDALPPRDGGATNSTVGATTFPNAAPRPAPWARASNPPYFDRAGALGSEATGQIPSNPVTDPLVGGDAASFLANTDNAYVRGSFSRQYGDVFVVRGMAPSYPDTRAGRPVYPAADGTHPQLRYWSVCMNEFATQRFVKCIADYQMHVDDNGVFTVVVSDPEDRPSNADAAHGLNYLPWPGAYYDALILYRHMLPAADFTYAIQRMKANTPITDQMGPYGLVGRYCAKDTIERQGVDACFAS